MMMFSGKRTDLRMVAAALCLALVMSVGSAPVMAADDNSGLIWGAIIGGAAGGVIGHQSGETGAGILIGVLVGGLVGHMIDESKEKEEARYREEGSDYRAGLDPINSMQGAEFNMGVTAARDSLPEDLAANWNKADQALGGDLEVYETDRGGNENYLYIFYNGRLFAMAKQKTMRESRADAAYSDAVDRYGRPTTYYKDDVPNWYDYNTKGFMYIDQKTLRRDEGEDDVEWVQFVTYQPTYDNVQPLAEDERFVGDQFFRERKN